MSEMSYGDLSTFPAGLPVPVQFVEDFKEAFPEAEVFADGKAYGIGFDGRLRFVFANLLQSLEVEGRKPQTGIAVENVSVFVQVESGDLPEDTPYTLGASTVLDLCDIMFSFMPKEMLVKKLERVSKGQCGEIEEVMVINWLKARQIDLTQFGSALKLAFDERFGG